LEIRTIIVLPVALVRVMDCNINFSKDQRENIAQKRRIGDVTRISRQADWRSMGGAWMRNYSGEIFHAQHIGEQEWTSRK